VNDYVYTGPTKIIEGLYMYFWRIANFQEVNNIIHERLKVEGVCEIGHTATNV